MWQRLLIAQWPDCGETMYSGSRNCSILQTSCCAFTITDSQAFMDAVGNCNHNWLHASCAVAISITKLPESCICNYVHHRSNDRAKTCSSSENKHILSLYRYKRANVSVYLYTAHSQYAILYIDTNFPVSFLYIFIVYLH